MIPRIKEQYNKSIIESLKKKLSVNNTYMVPKFVKIVLNMGLGKDGGDKKVLQNCIEDMSLISGQKPIVTRFKKSISNFKSRKGTPAGVKVTLRKNNRAKIKGINMVKKHIKTTKEKKGGIISKENFINISNLLIFKDKKNNIKEKKK